MLTTRSIPASTAQILEELELEQPKLVTKALLRELARRTQVSLPLDEIVERLRRHGWLLDLKTLGVWEFAPADRAGRFGSGDPFIELRASLLRKPALPVCVAAESAAWLCGFVGRPPSRHVIAAPAKVSLPPALGVFRVVRHSARLSAQVVDALPTWRVTSLLVGMATRPSMYRDWSNVDDWLAEAARDLDVSEIREELHGSKRSTWARTAYLLGRGGRGHVGLDLIAEAPPGQGPYYLGPRDRGGHFDPRYQVIDSYLEDPPNRNSAPS